VVSGTVNGDAGLIGERIKIRPGSVIAGDLIWRSERSPQISEQARIAGRIIERPLPPGAEAPRVPEVPMVTAGLLFVAGLMLAGVVLHLAFPALAERIAMTAQAKPGIALGLGFALLFATPFVIVLLFTTVVGTLLALILLALYLALLPLAWLAASVPVTGAWHCSADRGPARVHGCWRCLSPSPCCFCSSSFRCSASSSPWR